MLKQTSEVQPEHEEVRWQNDDKCVKRARHHGGQRHDGDLQQKEGRPN